MGFLSEIRVINLKPGDIIVGRFAETVTKDQVEAARERLIELFPRHQILLVSGVEIEIVRPAEG